jgi:predicted nuclease with TOPRIM domain
MPGEEKHKINVWIPESLWKQVGNIGFESPTKATIAAFEALVLQEEKGSSQEALGSSQEVLGSVPEIEGYKENIKALNVEIARLKEALFNAPDPVELAEVRAHFEGLKVLLEEREKRIVELNKHIDDISPFANYYKNKELKLIEATSEKEVKKPWYKRILDF